MKTEAEVGVMWPEAKEAKETGERQQPPKAGRGKEGFYSRTTRGSEAPLTP